MTEKEFREELVGNHWKHKIKIELNDGDDDTNELTTLITQDLRTVAKAVAYLLKKQEERKQ